MRKRALIVVSLSVLAFAGFTTAASATTIRYVTGGIVPSGDPITGTLKPGTSAVLSSSAGTITCTTSTFGGSIGTNPDTPSVTGSLTSLTFSNCTDTIPFVTVSTVTTNVSSSTPKTATATYVGVASTFAVAGVTATINFTNGTSCTYGVTNNNPATATHDSTTNPWNNEYRFNAVPLTRTSGTTVCSSSATWTATYVATSNGVGITIQP
ncbi:MAG TPA: hypothetical protein VGW75_12350 [Solirubrobacteraceae bacterium]|jgi:hypothetical protein|nr:hypothetical protein [Solirubrobacteraceae bacterium]